MTFDRMEECSQPLVSVPIITYNSSKTVMDTLDSIANQTYQNLELIVSDDCSSDNTVEICCEWIEAHKGRFARTELLASEKNTGVSANLNRAERACKGEWVKPLAGDDLLLPECISSFVEYINEHQDAVYVFAKLLPFREIGGDIQIVEIPLKYDFFSWSIEEQYHYLVYVQNQVPAPAAFYNKLKAEALGVENDERIPMMEDWPKWINLLKKEVRFLFLDKELVMYRLSEDSISNTSNKSNAYHVSFALFYIYYQFKEFYRHGNKKDAIKRYVQAKRYVENNLFWKGLNFMAKKIL